MIFCIKKKKFAIHLLFKFVMQIHFDAGDLLQARLQVLDLRGLQERGGCELCGRVEQVLRGYPGLYHAVQLGPAVSCLILLFLLVETKII